MLRFDIALQPLEPNTPCGDQAGFWQKTHDRYLTCMVDGLGHGVHAHLAAKQCIEVIAFHLELDLQSLMSLCNKELSSTRGVVLGLAEIDISNNSLHYMGLGNINACVVGERSTRLVNSYGILGQQYELTTFIQSLPFVLGRDILAMFSDGINETLAFDPYKGLIRAGEPAIAQLIVEQEAYGTDDAGMIIVN